jgi:hypothetical protein
VAPACNDRAQSKRSQSKCKSTNLATSSYHARSGSLTLNSAMHALFVWRNIRPIKWLSSSASIECAQDASRTPSSYPPEMSSICPPGAAMIPFHLDTSTGCFPTRSKGSGIENLLNSLLATGYTVRRNVAANLFLAKISTRRMAVKSANAASARRESAVIVT